MKPEMKPTKPERVRGGKPHRPGKSRWKGIEPRHDQSMTGVFAEEVAPYWECSEEEENETNEYGLKIPARRSLSAKQMLGIKRPKMELEPLRQRDRATGKLVAAGNRVAWKSESTLLRKGKPDLFGEGHGTRFVRETSRTKVRRAEIEIKPIAPGDDTETEINVGLNPAEIHDPLTEI